MKVREIHLIGLLRELDQILNGSVQGTHHNRHSFIYVLRILRALTEKLKKTKKKKMKNYTFTVEEIVCFHL